MAAQVNFYLYLNAFLSPKLFGAWKLAYIYPIKVFLTYSELNYVGNTGQRKRSDGELVKFAWEYYKKFS